MFDLLFARTFLIVGGMLLITAITSTINKRFETSLETWGTIIGTFVLLFAVMIFGNNYPLNLILVALFSGMMGWTIGPTVEYYGLRYKQKKYFKNKGIEIKKGHRYTQEQIEEASTAIHANEFHQSWHRIISLALFSTAVAVITTASLVFLTIFDFGFLGMFLFIALIILIIMGIANAIFFKSPLGMLIQSYFGVIIFTLYLIYDFNQLEKLAGDETWGTAVDMAVNIYLDIINLFLDILYILAESSD